MVTEIKKNKLSYSQIRTYNDCPQKYKYHYIDRIREVNRSSALLFGTAFDKAIESVLRDVNSHEREVFDKWWTRQKLNNQEVYLPDSLLVVYSNSDFDYDILHDDDLVFIQAKAQELVPEQLAQAQNECGILYDNCQAKKKEKSWSEAEHKFYNICNWFSLRRKGYLMLEANRAKVLPKFRKIIEVQKLIELDNGIGDSLVGYVDLLAEWEDGRTVIFDYKSSTVKYKADSVATSDQLTIYSLSLEIPHAGYIVFGKRIRKNKSKICLKCGFDSSTRAFKTCPANDTGVRCDGQLEQKIINCEVDVDFIIDKIPGHKEDATVNNIEEVNCGIKAGDFPKKLSSCHGPYGICPYFGKCHKNTDEGLIELGGSDGKTLTGSS